MRIALLSDIHGNLIALDAVLAEIASQQIDHLVCLGDVAAGGPQPFQVLTRLQQLNCPVVMGNTDAWLLQPQIKQQTSQFAQNDQDISLWIAQLLSDTDKAYIRTFQPTISLSLPQNKILLCYHGTPRSNREKILATTSDETLEDAFTGYNAHILAGGHTHIQLFRRYRDILILNPGSIGLPIDRVFPLNEIHNLPWAEYAILTTTNNTFSVEMRQVRFDIQAFIQVTLNSGMPHAEWSANEFYS